MIWVFRKSQRKMIIECVYCVFYSDLWTKINVLLFIKLKRYCYCWKLKRPRSLKYCVYCIAIVRKEGTEKLWGGIQIDYHIAIHSRITSKDKIVWICVWGNVAVNGFHSRVACCLYDSGTTLSNRGPLWFFQEIL